MKLAMGFVLFLIVMSTVSAYYINPYTGSAGTTTVDRSLGTQGGFNRVLAGRQGLAKQIGQVYNRRSIQTYTPYSSNELTTIRKSIKQNEYFIVKNDYNQYRSAISYADETLKQKLAKLRQLTAKTAQSYDF